MSFYIKLLLIMLVISINTQPADAQLGIRGGINLSRFIGDDVDEVKDKTGLNLGVSFPLLSAGIVSAVPEVYYSQKGATLQDQLLQMSGLTGVNGSMTEKTALRNADRGFVASGGFDINVWVYGIITFDARLVRGLSRLRDGTGQDDVRNQSFSLMLGYSLGY